MKKIFMSILFIMILNGCTNTYIEEIEPGFRIVVNTNITAKTQEISIVDLRNFPQQFQYKYLVRYFNYNLNQNNRNQTLVIKNCSSTLTDNNKNKLNNLSCSLIFLEKSKKRIFTRYYSNRQEKTVINNQAAEDLFTTFEQLSAYTETKKNIFNKRQQITELTNLDYNQFSDYWKIQTQISSEEIQF